MMAGLAGLEGVVRHDLQDGKGGASNRRMFLVIQLNHAGTKRDIFQMLHKYPNRNLIGHFMSHL